MEVPPEISLRHMRCTSDQGCGGELGSGGMIDPLISSSLLMSHCSSAVFWMWQGAFSCWMDLLPLGGSVCLKHHLHDNNELLDDQCFTLSVVSVSWLIGVCGDTSFLNILSKQIEDPTPL